MDFVDNLDELEKLLNKKMSSVLKNEVAEVIRETEQDAIDDEVYQGYKPNTKDEEPWQYVRRRTKGGLQDKQNMIADVNNTSNGVELTVTNITKGSQDNFEIGDLVEYGQGYQGKRYKYTENRDDTAWEYLRGRPFTKSTAEELERSEDHIKAFKQGMKRQGIDVE